MLTIYRRIYSTKLQKCAICRSSIPAGTYSHAVGTDDSIAVFNDHKACVKCLPKLVQIKDLYNELYADTINVDEYLEGLFDAT